MFIKNLERRLSLVWFRDCYQRIHQYKSELVIYNIRNVVKSSFDKYKESRIITTSDRDSCLSFSRNSGVSFTEDVFDRSIGKNEYQKRFIGYYDDYFDD